MNYIPTGYQPKPGPTPAAPRQGGDVITGRPFGLVVARDDGPDDPAGTGQWMAVDWAMKALSVAARACEIAGMPDIAAEVVTLHTMAQRRRDGR